MLIGLTGLAYSGKTTVAEHLKKKHGFKVVSIAGTIKQYAMKYFGLSRRDIERKDFHARTILQGIGEMIRKEIDNDYFLDEIELSYKPKRNIVIDDVRLLNEAERIKSLGGVIVKINCVNNAYHKTKLTAKHRNHSTEKEIMKIRPSFTIFHKAGEKESTFRQVDKFIKTAISQRQNNLQSLS
ncbi:MAG: hypothetical protein DDT19_00555 [Syntrophomonadaceae bacterium]|nr:hypothetical protein [Bacillota bacterium]